MNYLLWGLGALVVIYLIRRYLGDHQQEKSQQYAIFEKRFRLDRRTYRSQWGKGMGSRFSLDGKFRGYPTRLYSHFKGEGKSKQMWTSLTFETLFAGELGFLLNNKYGDEKSRFPLKDFLIHASDGPNEHFDFYSNEKELWVTLWNGDLNDRLTQLHEKLECGSIFLSKGFLEYRESSEMDTEAKRVRYQIAILLLADLADAISLYVKSTARD